MSMRDEEWINFYSRQTTEPKSNPFERQTLPKGTTSVRNPIIEDISYVNKEHPGCIPDNGITKLSQTYQALKFKVGDVVQLKSGGSAMTIEAFADPKVYEDADKCVSCVWFDSENRLQRDNFLTDTLKKY